MNSLVIIVSDRTHSPAGEERCAWHAPDRQPRVRRPTSGIRRGRASMPPAVCRPMYKAGAGVTDGSGRVAVLRDSVLFESALNGERRPGDTSGVFATRCRGLARAVRDAETG